MSLTPFVQTVLDRTDLVALIQERMSLKRAGATYTGCCPFHNEKTPSFHVYHQSEPPHYHCYGCGAHGDAISFLRELDHLEFMDALEKLAGRVGLEVPKADPKAQRVFDERSRLYEAMTQAQQIYQDQLHSHAQKQIALNYLNQRGVSDDMIALYGLGFAPGDRHLLSKTRDPGRLNDFRQLKLVLDNNDGRPPFDMFASRLMFPIRDRRGRCVAFGGRTLIDERSKYLNSSENPIFQKRQELFGLWETRKTFRQIEQLIVVEGYLDVITMTQFGVPGAVAMLGTATNEESLGNLLSVSDNLVFCFDGDAAGIAAADKAMQKILPLYQPGHQVRFLILPSGDDPDSFIRREGPKAFQERVISASPLSRYYLESLRRDLDISIPEQRMLWRKRALDLLSPFKGQPIHTALYGGVLEETRMPRFTPGMPFRQGVRGNTPPAAGDSTPPDPVRNRSVQTLALYALLEPRNGPELLKSLEGESQTTREYEWISWVVETKAANKEELLLHLVSDPQTHARFYSLFSTMTVIPSADLLIQEVEDALKHRKRAQIDQRLDEIGAAMSSDSGNEVLKAELKELMEARKALMGVVPRVQEGSA